MDKLTIENHFRGKFQAFYDRYLPQIQKASGDEVSGYLNFKLLLQRNYIQPEPLYLIGTNEVPADCDLLLIPGPRTAIDCSGPQSLSQQALRGPSRSCIRAAGDLRSAGLCSSMTSTSTPP